MILLKAKRLVILLFLIDILISIGLLIYKSEILDRSIDSDIIRLFIDIVIMILAYVGVKLMKHLYLITLFFAGTVSYFLSIGIFVTEENKLNGLVIIICGSIYLSIFFVLIFSRSVNIFFQKQHENFKRKYQNQKIF